MNNSISMFFPRLSRPNNAGRWFATAPEINEDIIIRYGRLPEGGDAIEWHEIAHSQCDGIGGLVYLLRNQGHEVAVVPQQRHGNVSTLRAVWNFFVDERRRQRALRRRGGRIAQRSLWAAEELSGSAGAIARSPEPFIAWHVFDATNSQHILQQARQHDVSMNTLLLCALDRAVRQYLPRRDKLLCWMVPTNMRGIQQVENDTDNYASYLNTLIGPHSSLHEVQRDIHRRLARGEHQSYAAIFAALSMLSKKAMMWHMRKQLARKKGPIGVLSNLGAWPDNNGDAWVFCPPIASCCALSAGCVTVGGKIGLCLQVNRRIRDGQLLAEKWLQQWCRYLNTLAK